MIDDQIFRGEESMLHRQIQLDYARMSDSRTSKKSKTSSDSGLGSDLDFDYKPLKIIVYRNGDKFDPGTEVSITRKEYKHWLAFLDGLTKRIRSLTAVHRLYTLDGREMEDFKDLDYGKQYVASSNEPFKEMRYGDVKPLKWAPSSTKLPYKDPTGLESVESIDIYLKKMGFDSEIVEASYPSYPKKRHRYANVMDGGIDVNGPRQKIFNPELRVKDKTVSLPKICVTNYQNSNGVDKNPLISRYKPPRSNSEEQIVISPQQNAGTGGTRTSADNLKNEKTPTNTNMNFLQSKDETEYPYADQMEEGIQFYSDEYLPDESRYTTTDSIAKGSKMKKQNFFYA